MSRQIDSGWTAGSKQKTDKKGQRKRLENKTVKTAEGQRSIKSGTDRGTESATF